MRKFTGIANRTALFFTVSSLLYTAALALLVKSDVSVSGVYTLVLKNYLTLFGFSAVFGVSYLIFDTKLAQGVKRLLHILILYAAAICACFVMASVTDDVRSKILFIFAATLVFVIIYVIGAGIRYSVQKLKR